jgi:hypothetical protein
MINHPETPRRELPNQQEKLVLPALPGGYPPVQASSPSHMTKQYGPEHLIRRDAVLPQDPIAKLRYFWHKDPAYRVLIIALVMVLVAGVVFVSLLANAMSGNPNFLAANSSTFSQTPVVPGPTGTGDLRPTFAPPGGSKGSTTSSQPPAHSTPSLQSTPTTQGSATPGSGTFTVQITRIPTRVQNYHTVTVGVSTSEPNVTVSLYVVYNVAPYKSFAGPTTSDGSGNATLSWTVMVYKASGARATVVAIARDQNGQKVQSQPVTVQISGIGG